MNARPPVHRTGSSLRHALTVWAWLREQDEPVTATAVAMLTGVSDRQARRTLTRLWAIGYACNVSDDGRGLWVALDGTP